LYFESIHPFEDSNGRIGRAIAEKALLQTTITELVTIKTRMNLGDPTLTDAEIARVTTAAPYNLDAWDGYAVEREKLYALLAGKNVVNLAGDTHNAWFTDLKDGSGNKVGTEIATSSVSSPGFEGYLGLTTNEAIQGFQGALEFLIDDLKYTDSSRRGYLKATFTQSNVTANWVFVDSISSENYSVDASKEEVISIG